MKQRIKKIFLKIVYHFFPIPFTTFQDFVTAARLNAFKCTVTERVTPCFTSDSICSVYNECAPSFWSIEIRGEKEDTFDILFTSAPHYYSPFLDDSSFFRIITEEKRRFINSLQNLELLKPELCNEN